MARIINTITVTPITNDEAAACMQSFGVSPGQLRPGVSIIPDLSTMPITWTMRITRALDAFDIVLAQIHGDPRVKLE